MGVNHQSFKSVVNYSVQFRSKSIICYQSYHNSSTTFKQTKAFRQNVQQLKEVEKYSGHMKAGTKKRLTKAVSLLVQSCPWRWIENPVVNKLVHHKLSFITLTLPDVEQSKDASFCHKYLLQPMLRILRNKYKMKSYVWKCELQKNGSVHYHITTDLFIIHTDLKNIWNNITRKHGLLDNFKNEYGHDNPNSTDIHSVQNINDLEAYLIKYISKEYQNEVKLSGKVWDCSKNLKEAKYFSIDSGYEVHNTITSELDNGYAKAIYTDHCIIIKFATTDYISIFSDQIIEQYRKHLNSILTWTPPPAKHPTSSMTPSTTELPTSLQCARYGQPRTVFRNTTNCAKQLKTFETSCYGRHSPTALQQ